MSTSCATFERPAGPPPRLNLSDEVGVVARACRFDLFPWQSHVLAKATAVDAEDRLLVNRVTLIVPRRNGKTQLVLALALSHCVLWSTPDAPAIVLYTAHLGDTARAVFVAALDLVNNSPWLSSQVKRIGYGKGDESILFKNGAKFHIRARTNAGGRGLECTVLVLDEALELKDDHMSALTPLVAKAIARGTGQTWVISSAGRGTSVILGAAKDKGRTTDDPSSVYLEWTVPRDADPADPSTWRQANPSLGTHVLDETFIRSQFEALTLESFGREHLGWWTDQVADPMLPHGAWESTAGPAPDMPARARVALGFELQAKGTAAVLVAAVALGAGRVWVEPVARWSNPDGLDPEQLSDEVRAHMKALKAHTVAGSSYSAGAVLDHLERKAGKPGVTRHNITHVRDASQTLLTAVTSGRLAHPVDADTDREVVNAGRAMTGDGLYRLSRTNSTGPSTAAFAVASAVHVILGPGPGRPAIVTGQRRTRP